MRSRVCGVIVLALLAAGSIPATARAKEEAWRHSSASAFRAGELDGVVVSDAGSVRLARPIESFGKLEADRVWALAKDKDGRLFAATGDQGRVYRREGKEGDWAIAFDAEDSQALSLAALPDGRVFVGTGPSGQVIELTDPSHPSSRPGPDVRYVWGLAAGSDGSLFAATGPTGQLWKRPAGENDWKLILDSPQKHLLCVVVDSEGTAFAGTDGEGLIYRVPSEGEPSVLYDAPQSEVQTLAISPDGVLHAGTAAGGDRPTGTPSPPRGGINDPADETSQLGRTSSPTSTIRRVSRLVAQERPEPSDSSPSGTARPKPSATGENAVYRFDPDGTAREIFRARALIYALAWQGDRLLVGTGPNGTLFEVRDQGREATELARVDHGQILAMLNMENGELLLGVGDPGGVLQLGAGYRRSGSLTSEVLDAKLTSRFGMLSWRADQPDGTSVQVRARTGQSGKPDKTWSDWSEPLTDPNSSRPDVPEGRFAQYRMTFESTEADQTPELRSLVWYYRTRNLAPEIGKINVPDLTTADGAATKVRLDLKWEASDPNDDDLSYRVSVRKEGWPGWIPLGGLDPLTEKGYTWDTSAFPSGVYRLRVEASDRASNPAREALTSTKASEPFLVDHEAPSITLEVIEDGRTVRAELHDDLTRLVKAEYALDGQDWVAIFPEDGLFDSTRETILIELPKLSAGPHVLMVRATDAAGNIGSADLVLQVP